MRSSAIVAPLEPSLSIIGERHEEVLVEIVRDSKEALIVLVERYLLDRISMGIPPGASGPDVITLAVKMAL